MRMTIFVLSLAASAPALAQSPAPAAPQKSLASTLEVYAFPNGGQDAAQQSKDEAECCGWAVQNTGNDPFDSASRAQQQIHQQSQQTQQLMAEQIENFKKALSVCLVAKNYMVKLELTARERRGERLEKGDLRFRTTAGWSF
jgi:hypothetical protein